MSEKKGNERGVEKGREPIAEPDLGPEPGWLAVEMPSLSMLKTSFIHGDPNGNRLRLRLYIREEDGRMFAKIWFGPQAEGPPGYAHGGSMAAVLDDLMGISSWAAGHPVMAATITIEFRRSLPLGRVVIGEAWPEKIEGKKIMAMGRLYDEDPEQPFARGEGLFIEQSLERYQKMIEAYQGNQS